VEGSPGCGFLKESSVGCPLEAAPWNCPLAGVNLSEVPEGGKLERVRFTVFPGGGCMKWSPGGGHMEVSSGGGPLEGVPGGNSL
jgi:hypothetical protein